MKTATLKCPLCDGSPVFNPLHQFSRHNQGVMGGFVKCPKCEIGICVCYNDYPQTPHHELFQDILDKWNTRTAKIKIESELYFCQELLMEFYEASVFTRKQNGNDSPSNRTQDGISMLYRACKKYEKSFLISNNNENPQPTPNSVNQKIV